MGSEQNRFAPPLLQQPLLEPPPPPLPRPFGRKRWVGCWSGLSCFGKQKGGKRIVPSSRIQEANSLANRPQVGVVNNNNNTTTGLAPSLLAPPSSPAFFSNNNSALPSTAQSPRCYLSANSPEGPSSTMFATGPYAHETQLVSPPVFSTFTTEPSTAPFTPPPELAHLTTPSSPDVPYARFLSSVGIKSAEKTNIITTSDLQSACSLYPVSPAYNNNNNNNNLRSPASRTTGEFLPSPSSERNLPSSVALQKPRSDSGRLNGLETVGTSKIPHDSNFFCPATFAEFYDQSLFPHSGGRLSVSKESDAYSNSGNVHQSRHSKNFKQEADEIEAYRASFGFSADEVITTAQYVEISDVTDDSFRMMPFASDNGQGQENVHIVSTDKTQAIEIDSTSQCCKSSSNDADLLDSHLKDNCSRKCPSNASRASSHEYQVVSEDEDIFSKMGNSRLCRKYPHGSSSSDAEIEYRRGKCLGEGKGLPHGRSNCRILAGTSDASFL